MAEKFRQRAWVLLVLVIAAGCTSPGATVLPLESPTVEIATETSASATSTAQPSAAPDATSVPTRVSLSASERQALRDLALAKGVSRFLALAASSGALSDILQAGPVTILAPMDTAITALPRSEQEALRNDDTGRAFVLRHVVRGSLTAPELVQAGTLSSLAGTELHIWQAPEGPVVDGVAIANPDLSTPIGLIQVLARTLPGP